jgi:hypothetical protein
MKYTIKTENNRPRAIWEIRPEVRIKVSAKIYNRQDNKREERYE